MLPPLHLRVLPFSITHVSIKANSRQGKLSEMNEPHHGENNTKKSEKETKMNLEPGLAWEKILNSTEIKGWYKPADQRHEEGLKRKWHLNWGFVG